MTDDGHENFGRRMNRLRRERGIPLGGPGRKSRDEKYRPLIRKAEATFAEALPDEAQRYVEELAPKEPERCPDHGRILGCPVQGCRTLSRRTEYSHKAAAYLFDRIMGRPLTRSENTLTVAFVRQVTEVFAQTFVEVNDITDPAERQAAFARRLSAIAVQYDAHAGGW